MKILVAAGGSGGHIFPASALIHELERTRKQVSFIFVISGRDQERMITGYLKESLLEFTVKISPLIPLRGRGIFAKVDFLAHLLWGAVYSFFLVLLERPRIVIGFGGYLSAPLIVAGCILRLPTLIHEQNVYPGRANLILAHIADRVALSFAASKGYFRKKAKLTVTGNPLRQDLQAMDRQLAARILGLNPDIFTILVLGGSQGATAINKKIVRLLEDIKKQKLTLQFIHIAGKKDFPEIMQAYENSGLAGKAFPFLKDMGLAYSSSDLVITRAGASTLNELSYLAKPAMAIPYPYAAGHQLLNARYYAERGALILLEEKDLTSELLFSCICEIIKDKDKRNSMSERIKELSCPSAAQLLAAEVRNLIYAH